MQKTTTRTTTRTAALALAGVVMAAGPASAALIDFEDAGTRGLSDDQMVVGQYASDGVVFSGAWLEDTAADTPDGFYNDQAGVYDQGATDGLGTYFLRTGSSVDERGPGDLGLSISFTRPTSSASGQVWDIDGNDAQGTEQWEVQALMDGTVVDTDLSPLGTSVTAGSLDGLPWTFELTGTFDEIRFAFLGSKTYGIGLAFDNFQTGLSDVEVSEPGTLALLGGSLAGLMLVTRRRRARNG